MTNLLSAEWIAYLSNYSSLIVGFSGGLDSTVLIHALASVSSLQKRLLAVHVNHQLSPHATDWQDHCALFCATHKVPFAGHKVTLPGKRNIEGEARRLRYEAFSSHLSPNSCLVLAHHLDDQAETLLLQLFRGAGIHGLSAMKAKSHSARPLLSHPKTVLYDYAMKHQLSWIEDESNQDEQLSRNYLRHQIFPLLREKWPALTQTLARAAHHCQEAAENLESLALIDCPELTQSSRSLGLAPLKKLSQKRVANILRLWLDKNQIQPPSSTRLQIIMDELLYARNDAMPQIVLGKQQLRRYRDRLYLVNPIHHRPSISLPWLHFPEPLTVAPQLMITAEKTNKGLKIPANARLEIRMRQGGEQLIWHGQTKTLKTLLQEWGIPPWQREQLPLLYINEELAAIPGYAVSDLFYESGEGECWSLIQRKSTI